MSPGNVILVLALAGVLCILLMLAFIYPDKAFRVVGDAFRYIIRGGRGSSGRK